MTTVNRSANLENLETDTLMDFTMPVESPQWLYEQHQDQICNILSQYDGPVGRVMLEEWIIEVSRTLCVNRDSRFRAEFQKILRRGAKVVLHDQITNSRNPTWCSEPGMQRRIRPNRDPESNFWIEGSSDPPPSYTSAATLPPIESSSDAPPPYTPTVSIPTGDRFAALPPFPDAENNIVVPAGTFDDFSPEEIINHYRPAITRMVFGAMGY